MTLKIYNTLTRQKEEFREREPGKAYIYVCGPTVHDFIHIGNARTFITFDVVNRYLRYRGYDVTFVQNITDIEDKIIKKSNESGIPASEIANRFEQEYFRDIKSLNIMRADVQPKATEHIPEMIEHIKGLMNRGMAYCIDGDVYFEVPRFSEYGKLSGMKLEELETGSRIGVNDLKKNSNDFVLWKSSKPGEPKWDSPWGQGRPGWHIECSVMSLKYLKSGFDIHGGAVDLVFPHHENEIAQSEGLTGETFVKYWMHGGMLNIGEQEMHKSLGNFITVRDLMLRYDFSTVRLFMLQTHYRSMLDFSEENLNAASNALDRINELNLRLDDILSAKKVGQLESDDFEDVKVFNQAKTDFMESMDDDFNTPGAVAVIFNLVREVNRILDDVNFEPRVDETVFALKAKTAIKELCSVLGLEPGRDKELTGELTASLVELLVNLREDARKKKDWQLSDRIRNELEKMGIALEDTATGTRWMLKKKEIS
ncbi:MAG: cysteine--tRNA ligase [Omnitrophica WOR_2 bacterium RBG_13_44_8]|nr:MAG: cysteine--tRNA ligase [Omnitrophica WOR_2 bacterium RBG_13_44_8]